MDIEGTRNAYATAATGLTAAAASGAEAAIKKTDEDGNPTLLSEIREKGFQTYAEEQRQKKIEEMRREILEAMGLTEEDLAKMPPEQRKQIEELIAQEIKERMHAQSELNGGDDKRDEALLKAKKMLDPVASSSMISNEMGLGPLLALQEADAAAEQKSPSLGEEDG